MENTEEKNQLDLDATLVETSHKIESFYENNKKAINYGIIGIVVAIVLYVGFKQYYLEPKEKEAQAAMFRAQSWFEQDSFNLALNGKGDAEGFNAIAENYGMTKAANLAHYYAGVCCMRTGDFNGAIDHLDDFSTDNELIGPLATGLLGDAYVETGDIEKGAGLYMKAANQGKNKLTAPYFLKKAGTAFEELKQYGKAADAYSKIKKEYAESQEAGDIDKYIARAEALEANNN
ncbi:MAG: hypothetical protein L6Q78_13060 [Bacteroidia bacterium]|nr:hypothetical protein [Bacteroidia bacterium]